MHPLLPAWSGHLGPVLILVAAASWLVGCSSDFIRKSQRTEGLLDLLLSPGSSSVADAVPVQTVSAGRGRISTGFVDQSPRGLVVHGLVCRARDAEPKSGAHLDVELLAADGSVIERATTGYSPHVIPPPVPGHIPYSRYRVQLHATTPPAGAFVRITFHDAPLRTCPHSPHPPL